MSTPETTARTRSNTASTNRPRPTAWAASARPVASTDRPMLSALTSQLSSPTTRRTGVAARSATYASIVAAASVRSIPPRSRAPTRTPEWIVSRVRRISVAAAASTATSSTATVTNAMRPPRGHRMNHCGPRTDVFVRFALCRSLREYVCCSSVISVPCPGYVHGRIRPADATGQQERRHS